MTFCVSGSELQTGNQAEIQSLYNEIKSNKEVKQAKYEALAG